MATPYYLEAPKGEEAPKPSFLDRVGTGLGNLWTNAPPEAFFSLAEAMARPGGPFASKLAMGLSGFGRQMGESQKQKSLASAFDQMAQTIPEQMRPVFEAARNDPEMQRSLVSTMASGMFAPPPKKTDDIQEYEFAKSQGFQGTFQDWDTQRRRASASTNSTTVNVGGSEKQLFDAVQARYDKVAPIVGGMNSLREARKLVNDGGMFGAGADIRVGASKVLSLLTGKPVDPAVVNTESFKAAIAPLVGATLKATSGTSQLSEGELKFAERASAGDINLDPTSIKRILDILEKAMNNTVRDYNRQLDFVYPKGSADRTRGLFELNLAPPAPAGELTFNPATGRLE